mmetsp:Transcript_106395/g.297920  ORF Transcript_106395/g.297920 Transcript_106395/m.297920 type:complete len:485 (+) Transcript_106395:79-1533(+)
MGAKCCAEREVPEGPQLSAQLWLAKNTRETEDLRVVFCSIRGYLTLAKRPFSAGDIVIRELPISFLFPHRDPPWLALARQELELESPGCAWHFCLAAHCLAEADLPLLPPVGLHHLDSEEAAKVTEISADCAAMDVMAEASAAASMTARHITKAACRLSGQAAEAIQEELRLARRLQAVAAGVASHGFRVVDRTARPPLQADALFYRGSFVNCCSAGAHSAAWAFDSARKTLMVRTRRALDVGEELTFALASKPWLAAPEDRACACTACCQARGREPRKSVTWAGAEMRYFSGSTEDDEGSTASEGAETPAATPAARTADPEPRGVESERAQAAGCGAVEAEAPGECEEDGGEEGKQPEAEQRPASTSPVPLGEAGASVESGPRASVESEPRAPLSGFARDRGNDGNQQRPMDSSAIATDSMSAVVSMSEDMRMLRLLRRCKCEGAVVPREVAERILREEGGNVGRAMSSLRRMYSRPSGGKPP